MSVVVVVRNRGDATRPLLSERLPCTKRRPNARGTHANPPDGLDGLGASHAAPHAVTSGFGDLAAIRVLRASISSFMK